MNREPISFTQGLGLDLDLDSLPPIRNLTVSQWNDHTNIQLIVASAEAVGAYAAQLGLEPQVYDEERWRHTTVEIERMGIRLVVGHAAIKALLPAAGEVSACAS